MSENKNTQKKEKVSIMSERVGAGAYGSIHKCNYKDKIYAMKIIRIHPDSKQGIPNIMETSIMASINHSYINNSLRITCESGYLYIMQELASSDLCKETRGKGLLKSSSGREKLRTWCLMMAEAVHCLHREGIIHCDIKASNILLFRSTSEERIKSRSSNEERIKLSDFSLAVKCWNSQSTREFSHQAGTNTHRAPECFTGSWGKEIDIWALGCTFFEIAYGSLLFPTQSRDSDPKDKETRKKNIARYINCLHDFLRGPGINPQFYAKSSGLISSREEIKDYTRAFFPSPEDEEEKLFLSLISSMLSERDKRINISEVLNHAYFKGQGKRIPYIVQTDNNVVLSNEERRRVERYISGYVGNNTFNNLEEEMIITDAALQLYTKCSRLTTINEKFKAAACLLIADKLINHNEATNIDLSLGYLLKAEREICEHLGFRLHSNIELKN